MYVMKYLGAKMRNIYETVLKTTDSFHIRRIRQGGPIRIGRIWQSFVIDGFVIQKYHIKATQDDNCSLQTWCNVLIYVVYNVFCLPQNTHF